MRRLLKRRRYAAVLTPMMIAAIVIPATSSNATSAQQRHGPSAAAVVAALDTKYQAAVKQNDAVTMSRILADDFVLVTGRGSAFTKEDLVTGARTKDCIFEEQQEVANTQTVRVYRHKTAIVTAQLWEKGTCQDGSTFDSHLWFSDTYVHANGHWSYVFGQASRPL